MKVCKTNIIDLPDHGEYWIDEKHFDPSFMRRVQYHRWLAEPLPWDGAGEEENARGFPR